MGDIHNSTPERQRKKGCYVQEEIKKQGRMEKEKAQKRNKTHQRA